MASAYKCLEEEENNTVELKAPTVTIPRGHTVELKTPTGRIARGKHRRAQDSHGYDTSRKRSSRLPQSQHLEANTVELKAPTVTIPRGGENTVELKATTVIPRGKYRGAQGSHGYDTSRTNRGAQGSHGSDSSRKIPWSQSLPRLGYLEEGDTSRKGKNSGALTAPTVTPRGKSRGVQALHLRRNCCPKASCRPLSLQRSHQRLQK